jgi:hypothetical protein
VFGGARIATRAISDWTRPSVRQSSVRQPSIWQSFWFVGYLTFHPKGPTIAHVGPVPDIQMAFYLSGLLRLRATIDPMRFLIGPIAVLIVLCGWDFYYNHGKFTRQAVAASSDIARRVF